MYDELLTEVAANKAMLLQGNAVTLCLHFIPGRV